MSTENTIYDFEQVAAAFVRKAAGYTGYRYRDYGVDREDVTQEIYAWLYGPGKAKVERWLANEPQQTTRIYRSMLDIGIRIGETEKANRLGYKPDDVWWYTKTSVEGLLPLVLDDTFTQANGHVGELLTMVVDIRRVMSADDFEWFTTEDDKHPEWDSRCRLLVERLGGARPFIGRRRVMSNAAAQHVTSELTE